MSKKGVNDLGFIHYYALETSKVFLGRPTGIPNIQRNKFNSKLRVICTREIHISYVKMRVNNSFSTLQIYLMTYAGESFIFHM